LVFALILALVFAIDFKVGPSVDCGQFGVVRLRVNALQTACRAPEYSVPFLGEFVAHQLAAQIAGRGVGRHQRLLPRSSTLPRGTPSTDERMGRGEGSRHSRDSASRGARTRN